MHTDSHVTPQALDVPHPPPHILLAEDNPVSQRLVVDYLTAKGFRVTCAEDGVAAVAAVRAEPPEVLLLDIQMPLLDGFAVLDALRHDADPRVRAVRVIALTAMAMRGDADRCFAAGADAYCSKPVSMRELVRLLLVQVAQARALHAPTQAPPEPPSVTP
jgi:CheY-like chemotaxis protein